MNYALTPEQKKDLQGAIQEISNSILRTEAERDPKKVISKIAKTYHKQNLAQEVADHEDFVELYEKITSK
jgi:hypothetical protein